MKDLISRRLALRTKFKRNQRIFGAWTSFAHPSISEIFAGAGVDFVGIDIEHSTISQEQSQRIIAACQASRTPCLPRVASHNMEMIKRLLDSGADGIIVPMVNNLSEAEEIVSWVKYSPVGKRSFGVARAQGYGKNFDEYTRSWNRSSTLIIQIESMEGVENIEQILSLDEIDGVMVGPYDLSGSLRIPGQLDHPKVKAACQRVIKACDALGKSCGTQLIEPDEPGIRRAFNSGFNFVVLASDVFILWKWAERMQNNIKRFRKA